MELVLYFFDIVHLNYSVSLDLKDLLDENRSIIYTYVYIINHIYTFTC